MKIAVVSNAKTSDWKSCLYINQNLLAAYRALPEQVEVFGITEKQQIDEALQVATRIKKFDPKYIVFAEASARKIFLLLSALTFAYRSRLPALVLHVFGDFSIEPRRWRNLTELIAGRRVHLVCASSRQSLFLRSFLAQGQQTVHTCPFPVNTARFYFDMDVRGKTRKALNWENKKIFLYTGRLSFQKNVLPLIQAFIESPYRDSQQILALAGSFDDIKAPLFSSYGKIGEYQLAVTEYVESLPLNQQKQIQFLGSLDQDRLFEIYNAADAYMSLATYHDEDFGMAPAEALATGLDCALSDWGGYADFIHNNTFCKSIPVKITTRGLALSKKHLNQSFHQFSLKNFDAQERQNHSRQFEKVYSPLSVSKTLQQILSQTPQVFYGFNGKMRYHEIRSTELLKNKGPYFSASATDNYYLSNYGYYSGEIR